MKFDTRTAAGYAADKLDSMLERATRDSEEIIQQNDLPATVAHFVELRAEVDHLKAKTTALQKLVDTLSHDIIPTQFTNANVKTINVIGVGRATINIKWYATMLNKERGMEWLRASGNEGLIITTVNAGTLTSFAKAEILAGKSLPEDLFKVSTSPFVSVTKSSVSNDERVE